MLRKHHVLFVCAWLFCGGMVAGFAGEGKPLLIQDFEKDFALSKWPSDVKGEVAFSTTWKVDGKRSLKIDPGLMYALADLINRNMAGYSTLRIHLYNPGNTTVTVGFELQDRYTQFHERHQNAFGVLPGAHVIEMDISGGLWRGEENKPYIGKIKTPIDFSKITRIGFSNRGKSPIYIDRIEAIKVPKIETPGGFAFDFGKVKTQVMSQMIGVFNNTRYTKARGFGLHGTPSVLGKAMSFPTPMLGDGIGFQGEGNFQVDLPGGKYRALIAFERGGFWGDEYTAYDAAAVLVNGNEVHRHTFSRDGIAFLFQDSEITDIKDLPEKLIWPAHAIQEFSFTAAKGANQFSLQLKNHYRYPLRIAGLVLAPDTAAGKKFIAAHIAHQKKTIARTFAGQDRSRRKGRVAPTNALVIEPRPIGSQTYPRDWPGEKAGASPPPQSAISGQTVTFQFSIYAKENTRVTVSSKHQASSGGQVVKISHGRYMPQRSYGVGSVWLEVNHYRPEAEFTVGPELTRSLVIEYPIRKNAKRGTIRDTISITVGATRKTIPIIINVLPVPLVDIPIPVGLFFSGLPVAPELLPDADWWRLQESLVKEQMEAGLTAQTGGTGVRYQYKKTGAGGRFSGARALRYIALAKKYGTLHATVGYGGLTGSLKNNRENPAAFSKAWLAFEKANKLPPHIFNAYDEPRFDKGKLAIAAYLKPFTKAGLRSAGWTSWHGSSEAWMTMAKASDIVALNIHTAENIKTIKAWGGHPWVYNNGLNRYGMGLHLWRGIKLGVEGRIQWIGLFTQGFAFHNLDGREPSISCFLIHRKFGVLKTPLWLSVREGLLDARIRLTLEKNVKKNDSALTVWTLDGYRKDEKEWSDERLEKARRAMLKSLESARQ